MEQFFVVDQRYLIVTLDDSLYEGTIVSVGPDILTILLSEDSDYFNAGDTVTIFGDKIIAFRQIPPAETGSGQ